MDQPSSVVLERIVEHGNYFKCTYRLTDAIITRVTTLCDKDFGCCSEGCCETKYVDTIRKDSTHDSATIWCVMLGLIAIAVLLLVLSASMFIWKQLHANNTKTATVIPSVFPKVKIQPVEYGPKPNPISEPVKE